MHILGLLEALEELGELTNGVDDGAKLLERGKMRIRPKSKDVSTKNVFDQVSGGKRKRNL